VRKETEGGLGRRHLHDPTDKRAPKTPTKGGTVTITEAEPSFERIPAVFGGVPRYELEFDKGRPFARPSRPGRASSTLTWAASP
jgi:hypothetical protein